MSKLNETFTERLGLMLHTCHLKHNDYYISISFQSIVEAQKYKDMHPNRKCLITHSYLYEKAEDAFSPSKLTVVVE